MGPTGFPETSVQNYPSRLRNSPEGRRSQIAPFAIHKRDISQSADFVEILVMPKTILSRVPEF